MIQHAERDRMLIAGAGAVVIHALFFAALWLYAPQAAKLPIAVLPVYVELNAAPIVAPSVPAPAPVQPRVTTPASQMPQPQQQSARVAPSAPVAQPAPAQAPAPREYDPLAAPPGQNAGAGTATAPSAPQPSSAPAPVSTGPTAAALALEQANQQALQKWEQNNPSVSQPSPSPAAAASNSKGRAAPAQDAAGQAIDRTINQTMNAIQSAPAAAPAVAATPSTAPGTSGSSSTGAATTPTGSGSGYSDSRLTFTRGQPRGLVSEGRLKLNPQIVNQILSQHPDHSPRIDVPVKFQVDASGFVSNLQLLRSSGYTQLDEAIRNLFNGQVFVAAPGDPVATGAIDYVIETHQ
ncbi:MAG TPA: hypothetical protein VMW73_03120 [Spirochaetia bacterium]|nr:hypothetical protein [Spirochaetia bacterium]